VRLPHDITPGAAARRALLADLLIAICIALVALLLAAGVGVVGFVALPVLLLLLAWIAIEAVVRSARRRSSRRSSPAVAESDRSQGQPAAVGADRGQAGGGGHGDELDGD
jgi:membrane protein implicated in regulation of membrane protease activity